MASSKLIALFLAFAMASAALQPSEASRVVKAHQRCNCKPEAPPSHEPEKVALQADAGGVPSQPTPPGIPAGAGQLPPRLLPAILGMLFPPAADGAGVPSQPTPPGIPAGAGGQLPPGLLPAILGMLFPPLGGIIGLLQPLIPPPGSSPPQLGGGGSSPSSPPQPTECMTPLQSMLPCMGYLTNLTVAAPGGECCDGLKGVIRDAPICLCHGMNGGMNQFLPSPVDPLRMTVLPLACGTVLPIQTLFMCNSQQVPPIMPPATPAAPPPVSP